MSILDESILLGLGKRMRILRKIAVNLKSRMQKLEQDDETNKTEIYNIKERLEALETTPEP